MTKLAALVLALASFAAARPALADDAAVHDHLDVEVDPTAYVLGGFSVHAGAGRGHLRLDLGAYAMDVPEWAHGQEGFDLSFWGFGAKLQWFPLAEQRGLLLDVGGGFQREAITLHDTGERTRTNVVGIGVSAGWRFWLPHGFYATPWVALDYDLGASDVMLGGKTFHAPSISPFAAIHVGFRFQ
jgi:hypothetical protein